MPYEIDDAHYEDVIAYSALDRYDYFMERIAANGELWTLKTAEGFVTMDSGDELPAIPFWPHPRYAEAQANDESEFHPIALDNFVDAWLPGMKEEGRKLVVFPVAGAENVIIEASKVRRDLHEEMEGDAK